MSGPDDMDPPFPGLPGVRDVFGEPAALGELPENDTEPPAAAIPLGHAMATLEAALSDFYRAAIMLESVAAACARACDQRHE